MARTFVGAVALGAGCAPDPGALVDLGRVDSSILLDVKYATSDNLFRQPVYPVARVLLRRSVAERLRRVQKRLRTGGLGLKVHDGYRPRSVQWRMWRLVPDPRYVANPRRGSKHNRGAAVDVTLVDAQGGDVPMPTPYDEFSERAGSAYEDIAEPARTNRGILQRAMAAEGFLKIRDEWWHFDAPDWQRYRLSDVPLERAGALRMTVPLASLLGFVGWTLVLLIAIGTVRNLEVLRGRARPNAFPADVPHGPDRYRRLLRAHMNCVENLPVLAAVVLVAAGLGVESPRFDVLSVAYLGARVGQSLTHVASGSSPAAIIRFLFFVVQLAAVIALIALVVLETA